MKKLFFLFYILAHFTSQAQKPALKISTNVDTTNLFNKEIIIALKGFLETKDQSPTKNNYWLASDFKKFIYPYKELQNIENSTLGKNFYWPFLLNISATANNNQKLVKVSWRGFNTATAQKMTKVTYTMMATTQNKGIVFSKYENYSTKNWKEVVVGTITYKLSPTKKKLNDDEVRKQEWDINGITIFFDTQAIPLLYYSCTTPRELFEMMGVDQFSSMYNTNEIGLAGLDNFIYSGNNTDVFTHEVVHIYTMHLFPSIHHFFEEGIATFIGGANGQLNYEWHRIVFKKFLAEHPQLQLSEHIDTDEESYAEESISIPYMIAALVCERTLRLYGKEKLFELFKSSNKDLFDILKLVGLTKENMDEELRKELAQPFTINWRDL